MKPQLLIRALVATCRLAIGVASGVAIGVVMPRAASANSALAEVVVESDADANAPNARVAALDAAFADATKQALGELIDKATFDANKTLLNKEVLGRARLWVASFAVDSDTTSEQRRKLTVRVKISQDKLVAKLVELGIIKDDDAPAGQSPASTLTPTVTASSRPTMTVLLRQSGAAKDQQPTSNFGVAKTSVPAFEPMLTAVKAAGFALVPPSAVGPSASAEGHWPITDDAASHLARNVGAAQLVIADLQQSEPSRVHGAAGLFVRLFAHAKWLDVDGNTVATKQQAIVVPAAEVSGATEQLVASQAAELLAAATEQALPTIATPTLQAPTDGSVLVVANVGQVGIASGLAKHLGATLVALTPNGYRLRVPNGTPAKVATRAKAFAVPSFVMTVTQKAGVIKVNAVRAPAMAPNPNPAVPTS